MTASIPRLPLRDELFLLGHDDDTGHLHVHRQTLALGLAGAVLIDLYLAGRVTLDPNDDTRPASHQRIHPHVDRPVGDLIADAATATIRHTHPPLRVWLRGFSDDLYDRTRAGLVAGGILLYFAFVFDCVDGQVARYTRQFSTLGAWLDATFDRAKEYLAYAGLAVGYGVTHPGDVWGLACAVIILQTCRHMVDFSFAVHKGAAPPAPIKEIPLDVPDDSLLDPPARAAAARRGGLGMLAVRASAALERVPGARWAKKIVILPIGERFALIALTAAFFDARVTFLALLAWGGLAAAYTLSGRILRSLA